jgi:phosphate transport system permease protein
MAIDTDTRQESRFGEVSRLKGVVFEYVTLGASLFGIVALAILLGYVAIDAFGLEQADLRWYGTYFVTLVLPTLAFAAYAVRNPDVGAVAGGTLFRLFAGVAGGTAVVVLFIIADVQAWLLVYTFGLLPPVAAVVYARQTGARWATFPTPHLLFIVGTALGVYLKGPVDTFPTDWLIYLWTIAVPAAAIVGALTLQRTDDRRRAGLVAGGIVVGVAVGSLVVELLGLGLGRKTAAVFLVTLGVPTTAYVVRVLARHRERAVGLLAPVVIVGGALLGAYVVRAVGASQPEPWLDWQFLTSAPSRFPQEAGLYPAIIGSVFVISLVALLSFVLGVSTAIFLEEYAPSTGWQGTATRIIQVNISNLAGVPSVVYGLLGLGLFINLLNMGIGTVAVASVTLSLLILPITIISSQEAIRSVPDALRQASYGMGATKWQTVRNVVLPRALPGVLTGTILALGRAIGETAPLILIGFPTTMFSAPGGLFSKATAMPMQIYAWATFPQEEFRYGVVAAGVVTLLAVLLTVNSVAIYVRNKYQQSQ